MEEITSAETQEVAEPVQEVAETSEQTQEVAEPVNTETPKVEENRDLERDANFAKMRRSMEQTQKELESAKSEQARLTAMLNRLNFNGNSVDDLDDEVTAWETHREVDDVRQERIERTQKEAEENSIREQLKYYKDKEIADRMNKDLSDIKKLNPTIQSLNQLPPEYFDLVSKGIEGARAYKLLEIEGHFKEAQQVAEQKAVEKIQANAKASVGSASNGKPAEPISYANMSDAEFDKYLQKAKRGELSSL